MSVIDEKKKTISNYYKNLVLNLCIKITSSIYTDINNELLSLIVRFCTFFVDELWIVDNYRF